MVVKIGINGFGRIGRMILRQSLKREDIEVVAINDLASVQTLAHLFKWDSIHSNIGVNVQIIDENHLMVNEKLIHVTAYRNPADILWIKHGVEIVAECTGLFKDKEGVRPHLEAGAKKVVISAPAKNPDITIVMGVNQNQYEPDKHHIISSASCTTNCLAPVAKVLLERFGIISGLMTTIHAYTGDQRLVDSPHNDLRRARSAALSMIPTTTGAAKSVALVLPELAGKLNGLSVRVPTPNVSLVDFVVQLEKPQVTSNEINEAFQEASKSELAGILEVSELPLVSIDYNGTTLSSIVDADCTYVNGNLAKVLAWYDNEAGYSARMLDLMSMIAREL